MIRKFATIPGLKLFCFAILVIVLMGVATVHAQQAPASEPTAPAQTQQQPDQSSSQETSDETAPRRVKKRDYKKWTFNVGGGASLPSGTTDTYVRGGGGVAAAGVARNYSKYFGFRLDFQFDNLPLRTSALQLAQAPGANNHVYSLMLDPIINIPVSKNWGGYLVFGGNFQHRSGKLDSSSAIPGSACNGFFTWWGTCHAAALPIDGNFLHSSQNEFGGNFGGGITRKIRPNIDFYAEFRFIHGKHSNITTDVRPITIGIRW
jgi:hypothetical protein